MGARRTEKMEEVKTAIEKDGGQAVHRKTDVTVREEVIDLVKFAETTFGPVDIFVHNVGVFYYSLMKNLHLDEWDKLVDVNCKGFLNGIAAILDSMVKRKRGHILIISSDSGKKSDPGCSVYTGSKFFVEGVVRGLRREVSTHNVRVTSIQPGEVDTEIFTYSKTDPEAEELYGSFPPNFKILEPIDVAKAVVYAVSQPDHVAVNELLIQPKDAPIIY
ncbi:uncharacterized protein LOC135482199 [Liolophura sinensis]|uniref:uncharacterized protein LOC135482199 n=1 Tax=Liolophura sinensis TaxID=3198878 RepID=UPI0031588CFB